MKKHHSKKLFRLIWFVLVLLPVGKCLAQLSYPSGPHGYAIGTPITPLSPTNTGTLLPPGQTSTLAGSGSVGSYNGTGTGATFNHPIAVAADASGNIYVADRLNYLLRKIAPGGSVSTVPGTSFQLPNSVAIDASGNIYVADEWANKIIKINTSGTVSTYAGTGSAGSANGSASSATFNYPFGIAIDQAGNLYVAEVNNHDIRMISSSGMVSTLAGSGSAGYANGTGTSASFNQPLAVAVDASGYVYVADASNHMIRKITPAGVVTTLAGAGSGFYADGTGGSAGFDHPAGVAVDASGNVYVGDENNNMIRKITPAGDVSTLAGTGSSGSANGAGSAATFNYPCNIAVDGSGTVYVADYNNNMVRKVAPGGYSITPALPQGLVFDSATGTISGTPTVNTVATAYTVTALNVGGPTSIQVIIATGQVDFAPSDENFIITYTPRTEISDITQFNGASVGDVNRTVAYFDGLGRPMQTVNWKATPNQNDLVLPNEYDAYGREAKKYLPYADNVNANNGAYRATAIADQLNFYHPTGTASTVTQLAGGIAHIPTPFAQANFELSPLERPVEQGAPGDAWQPVPNSNTGHTLKTTYALNADSEVKLWTITSTGATASTYAAGTLYKTITADENWVAADLKKGTTEEFKDMEGRVVLKRVWETDSKSLSTYYVYDDYGNLSYVLPPAVNENGQSTITTGFVETDSAFINFIYAYRYDERKHLTRKKLPGKDWEYLIYNSLDQVVATQDGNQRNKANQDWTFTRYDALGRVVMTGIYQSGANAGQDYYNDVKTAVDAISVLWETPTGLSTNYGYNYASFPSSINKVLSVNYYDTYAFAGSNPYTYAGSNMTTGLLTGSLTNVLGSSDMLWTEHYYDDKGRNIKTFQQHYLNGVVSANNYDEVSSNYDFTNEVTHTKREHNINNSGTKVLSLTVANAYDYDHTGRKLKTWQRMDNATDSIVLSQTNYNEIGQLIAKKLHSINGGANFLQTIDYRYNPRGWLSSINNAALSNDGGVTNNDNNDQFGLELSYEGTTTSDKQYNGNISSMKWKAAPVSTFTPQQLGYDFRYDRLNRLKEAVSSTNGTKDSNYSEFINYDVMGNISNLGRYALLPTVKTQMDSLIYSYTGNQHTRIDDNTGNTGGFNDRSQTTDEYTYDQNGNNNKDLNNNISSIAYNLLNLPQTVSFANGNQLNYTYAADGMKLKKVFTTSSATTTTEYIAGIEYDQGVLSFVQTEEGRARLDGTYKYEYDLKDHLGNSRVTVIPDPGDASQQTVKAVQVNSYYAFGMDMPNQNNILNVKNEHLYNGKELQEELGQYDYGARFYNPVIARWTTPDPLAEVSRRWSLYNYAENNPIRNIDPDGMETMSSEDFSFMAHYDPHKLPNLSNTDLDLFPFDNNTLNSDGDGHGNNIKDWPNPGNFIPHYIAADDGKKSDDKGKDKDNNSSNNRNPAQDKKLTPGDIKNLQEQGWDHRDKGDHGGQTDLWKDREGNVYQKPKNGQGPGEPIGYNLNNFSRSNGSRMNDAVRKGAKVGLGLAIGIGAWEVVKWGAAVFFIPETLGGSLGVAAATP